MSKPKLQNDSNCWILPLSSYPLIVGKRFWYEFQCHYIAFEKYFDIKEPERLKLVEKYVEEKMKEYDKADN